VKRLQIVLGSAPLTLTGTPTPVESDSNDTWLVEESAHGAAVLRVCWRGDTDRLLREGLVGTRAPAAVAYPTMIDFGRVPGDHDLTWSLTRRLPGESLGDAWPGLSAATRREACRGLAGMIKALHGWRPEESLRDQLVPRPLSPSPTASEAVGRSINPLPDGVRVLLDRAREIGGDASLITEASRLLERDAHLVPVFDDPARHGIVHSDLHLQNVWWDGRRVTGLLDLEWVRLAPSYVDLVELTVNADADGPDGVGGHAELLHWLGEDYPEIFEVDHLQARLRVLQVAAQVRALGLWGPPAAGAPLPADHPVVQLRRLLGR